MRSVVICEKPSQARNIVAAVGDRYGAVLAAQGHLLRLATPEEVNPAWSDWSFDLLRPESGFYPLRPDHSKTKRLAEIETALKSADRVILATDWDREGQAIGENLLRYFRFGGEVLRALFSAEDPKTLREAFNQLQPNTVCLPLYQAAVARAQADQIANLTATRVVTKALKPETMRGAIGVGRVKTPTMALVCRREREIANFRSQGYYDLWMDAEHAGAIVRLHNRSTPATRILDKAVATDLTDKLHGWECLLRVENRLARQAPPRFMDLPSLQQRASTWGWATKKTSDTAQALYQDHQIITYPRTENTYLKEVAADDAQAMLDGLRQLGIARISYSEPTIRKGKEGHFWDGAFGVGESHHAIVPNFNSMPQWADRLPRLDADERRLFELIARSYMAAIGPDREYDRTEIFVEVFQRKFSAVGVLDRVMGWKEAFADFAAAVEMESDDGDANDDADKPADLAQLPAWSDGAPARAAKTGFTTKTTQPPPRYSEGSLVKAMKEAWRFAEGDKAEALKNAKGIGTGGTRGSIIDGLKRQGFFAVTKNKIAATDLALAIYDILLTETPELLDPAETAEMEMALDGIMKGQSQPRAVVDALTAKIGNLARKMEARAAQGPLNVAVRQPPSKPLLEAARTKAAREGVSLPRGAATDAQICRDFLGPRPEGTSPSPAQLDYARSIARTLGKELTPEVEGDRRALRDWIDTHKDQMPEERPSPAQINLAETLAQRAGERVPDEVMRSKSLMAKWLDARRGTRKPATGKAKSAGRRKSR